ncbi:MAG: hypothetical protein R3C16_06710 [Hyphomonadaceae bacterium]
MIAADGRGGSERKAQQRCMALRFAAALRAGAFLAVFARVRFCFARFAAAMTLPLIVLTTGGCAPCDPHVNRFASLASERLATLRRLSRRSM